MAAYVSREVIGKKFPGKFPPISLIVFLHSFLTKHFVHKWGWGDGGGGGGINPSRMKNFDMSRMTKCSHLKKKSKNQRNKRCLATDFHHETRDLEGRIPSKSLMKRVVCKYRASLEFESTSNDLRANTPTVTSVPF